MKTVLVTGASHGIGKSIAEKLSASGYRIIGIYNSTPILELEQLKSTINNSVWYQADLSNREQTLNLIKTLSTEKLYGIVNDAGQYIPEKFTDYDIDIWDKIMELHVATPLLLCTKLQNNLESGGSIVNIASIYGVVLGGFSGIVYAASKAAISNLTKTLANVFGSKNIRANAIAPGMVKTRLSTNNGQVTLDNIAKNTPLGRIGEPSEIAEIVEFLLSSKSSYIKEISLQGLSS